mmetsp:Transcript_39182/g.92016  ORF Transcript_39182/g.92016 Transcript_39182/m.92016 type:complete len:247 (-) Transcript_39182:3189-3929(-)
MQFAFGIERLALARAHRHVPTRLAVREPLALVHALIARVAPGIALLAVQQTRGLRHVVDVCGGADDAVHQARVRIRTNVRLHAEVPLVALLGLVHLGVALAVLVLGGARRGNDGRVHHRASPEHESLLGQAGIDRGQHLRRELVLLQQVSKAQDGGLVGHARCPFKTDETAVQRPLVQFLFHRRIAQVPPQLQAVDAQHGLDGERRPAAQRLMRTSGMRLDQRHQRGPGHHLVHLVEEDFLAGLLG